MDLFQAYRDRHAPRLSEATDVGGAVEKEVNNREWG